jgi:hypothetical protein
MCRMQQSIDRTSYKAAVSLDILVPPETLTTSTSP